VAAASALSVAVTDASVESVVDPFAGVVAESVAAVLSESVGEAMVDESLAVASAVADTSLGESVALASVAESVPVAVASVPVAVTSVDPVAVDSMTDEPVGVGVASDESEPVAVASASEESVAVAAPEPVTATLESAEPVAAAPEDESVADASTLVPVAVESGKMSEPVAVVVPVADAVEFEAVDVALAPSTRTWTNCACALATSRVERSWMYGWFGPPRMVSPKWWSAYTLRRNASPAEGQRVLLDSRKLRRTEQRILLFIAIPRLKLDGPSARTRGREQRLRTCGSHIPLPSVSAKKMSSGWTGNSWPPKVNVTLTSESHGKDTVPSSFRTAPVKFP
jgi:hypothetical protein